MMLPSSGGLSSRVPNPSRPGLNLSFAANFVAVWVVTWTNDHEKLLSEKAEYKRMGTISPVLTYS